jgi:hypothetical protein
MRLVLTKYIVGDLFESYASYELRLVITAATANITQ